MSLAKAIREGRGGQLRRLWKGLDRQLGRTGVGNRMVWAGWVIAVVVVILYIATLIRRYEPAEHPGAALKKVDVYPYGLEDVSSEDVECIGWMSDDWLYQCHHMVANSETGYCVIKDHKRRRHYKIMETSPGPFFQRKEFTCDEVYLRFMNFRIGAERIARAMILKRQNLMTAGSLDESRPSRGIVMAAYDALMPATDAIIRHIRNLGCKLPIEIWRREGEISSEPGVSLLKYLRENHNVSTKTITDPSIEGFSVKVFAIAESSFDQLLFLDSDNIPVRDPSYLFELPEFQDTGAIFWPDFWHPNFTIFDMGRGGLAWELFGLNFKYEMEQESGQLMVDRRRCKEALTLALYYARNFDVVRDLKAAWGDKDLYRFAFKKTKTPYRMVNTLPALLGEFRLTPWQHLFGAPTWRKRPSHEFCGQTMVQHDPHGDIIFLHRNTVKLHTEEGKHVTWKKIQRYSGDLGNFRVTIGRRPPPSTCFFIDDLTIPEYTEDDRRPRSPVRVEMADYSGLEQTIIDLVTEAEVVVPKAH